MTKASDDTPTNKLGSDTYTTSTSLVLAEGGKSSSPLSVGMENSDTTPRNADNLSTQIFQFIFNKSLDIIQYTY